MNLNHIYKSRTTATSLRAWFRQFPLTFINEHPEVFEALTRHATPFGGNWWPVSQHAAKPELVQVTRAQIRNIQQQLDELTRIVTRLHDQLDSGHVSANPFPGATRKQSGVANPSATRTKEIGINRFRTLQTRS